ncbi:hypothetical protein [Kitasatospora sp. NPDC093679]|uniref:hypothetical protein n=1 Tax=Kitasatospora sp. NPDC093679 TaxID=3154983 RepID=UPI0034137884
MRTTADISLPPLRAGRQPAGRAVLSWLDDPRAPRLCRVTGSEGAGASFLVSWLAAACGASAAPVGRRLDAALSVACLDVPAVGWSLARRLGLQTSGADGLEAELAAAGQGRTLAVWDVNRSADPAGVAALLVRLSMLPGVRVVADIATGPAGAAGSIGPAAAVLDLDDPRWTDRERFERWYEALRAAAGDISPFTARDVYPSPRRALLAARVPAGTAPALGVEAAWWTGVAPDLRPALRALAACQRPVTRAQWAAMAGDAAVDRLTALLPPEPAGERGQSTWWLPGKQLRELVLRDAPAAGALAAPRTWRTGWTHWRNAGEPDFGAGALTQGAYAGWVLLLDAAGRLRAVSLADGSLAEVPALPAPGHIRSFTAVEDGSVAVLDGAGLPRLLAGSTVPHLPAPDALRGAEPSVLGPVAGTVGDTAGTVHWLGIASAARKRLHDGPVTALGAALPEGGLGPVLVSGGLDGQVQVWRLGTAPGPEPVEEREVPVVAVGVGAGADGLLLAAAWSDGLVRVRPLDGERPAAADVRVGSPVRSVHIAPGGTVVVVAADGALALQPPAFAAQGPGAVDAALQALAAGEAGAQDFLAVLLDAELLLCTDADTGALFTSPGVRGREAVDACTAPDLTPRHWPGTTVLTGRELAAAAAGCDLRLTAAGGAGISLPVDDLARATG